MPALTLEWIIPISHLCLCVAVGMVQAWVAQKTLKRDILKVFTMFDFINIFKEIMVNDT